ncbi:hypothetical protein [Haloechinothrix salitolerans]|uniref:Uncharacterized protein n=1 Tax=Haloechinothrix salitolerans TaxID=926830 RepID=A0ABW2BXB7_9PSEU
MATSAAADHAVVPIAVHTILHHELPDLALTLAVIAAFWLSFAAIALGGIYIGGVVFHVARRLFRGRDLRNRRNAEHADPATIHRDDVATQIIDLDHYRHRRQRHGKPTTTMRADGSEPDPDEPA